MVSLTGRPLERPDLVRTMMGRLVHRGPDDEGLYCNHSRTVCLGHRRLSIIDLANGRQPLGNEDQSVMVTFNGEIFGFQSVRDAMEARGHRFKTRTDTEVIVHSYEDAGPECLKILKGMFAFALWDERDETLLLARDRLGKKPLYYAICDGVFHFASELQALEMVPGLSRCLDAIALDHYFTFGYIPAPRTIYQDVQKLEAGHYLLIRQGEVRKERYWSPRASGEVASGWEEAKGELVRRLREATALRMVSDVPIGCFLSGGVDSSTVLSFMAELSGGPVKTFSIGFPEKDFSELEHARTMARHFGTDHHEYVVEPEAVGILDQVVDYLGEPFADSTALPTWYLSRLTRKSVTVALTGDGGDELFGGYGWYRNGLMLERVSAVPTWAARIAARLSTLERPRFLRAAGNAAALLTMTPGQRYAMLRQAASPKTRAAFYSREFLAAVEGSAIAWLSRQYEECGVDDPLNRHMATDLATYMPEDLLVKVDRMAMASSLECRSPLLDADLAEWALGLPVSYKCSWHGSKLLLREAVRNRFPPGFLNRPKQSFSVPLSQWFRGDLRSTVADRVLAGPLRKLGLLNVSGLERLVSEHFGGKRNHEETIWALLVLASWADRRHLN